MQPHHERTPTHTEAATLAHRLTGAIPVLQSARLTLRAPKISDFSTYADIALSPQGRFLIVEQDREHAWYDFVNMVACWVLRGHGLWTVEKRDDGTVVGFALIGFEPGDHEPELGYMVRAEAEGFGYATEAAAAAKQFAFGQLGFATLVSTIDPDNEGSIHVARKLGGVRDPHAEQAHHNETLVFRYAPDDE